MAIPSDFRTQPLTLRAISDCGHYAGKSSYWRLYAIENLIRVIVHSVLSVQIAPAWWSVAISSSSKVGRSVQKVKADYQSQPNRSSPGNHDIYYLFLPQLTKTIATHAHLFRRTIPDIDAWIARLEAIRLPRNIVGHMNWLNSTDRADIDSLYKDLKLLHRRLENSGFNLPIP